MPPRLNDNILSNDFQNLAREPSLDNEKFFTESPLLFVLSSSRVSSSWSPAELSTKDKVATCFDASSRSNALRFPEPSRSGGQSLSSDLSRHESLCDFETYATAVLPVWI